MKVAVAVDGSDVAAHFGRCEAYLVADVAEGAVGPAERVQNPGHEPGMLPRMLHGMGVECIVAGGMGPRAIGLFEGFGIQAIAGVSGPAQEALELLSRGELRGGPSACHH